MTKDLGEAVKWYRKAAVQGLAQAQMNLGLCCFYGLGTAKDPREAEKWFRKAADQGNTGAKLFLDQIEAQSRK